MNNTTKHYCSEHATMKDQLPGARLGWLNMSRKAALATFEKEGFPDPRIEDWKYTSVRPIEKHLFKLAQKTDHPINATTINTLLCGDMACHLMVFVDGRYSPDLSDPRNSSGQVTIKDLHTALVEDTDVLEANLGKIADASKNGFAALNMALMNDGAYIKIADNASLELPIHLMFLSSGKEGVTNQTRILIVAGAGSQARIIESYQSVVTGSVYFNNITTEIKAEANTDIEHYKLQQESNKAFHIATSQVAQAEDSTFTSFSISMGAQIARNDINIRMGNEGAACNLYGLYITDGRQHCDFHTSIDHAEPHCNSNESYKGILGGHSRAVFNGQVYIHPGAQKSAARQENNNLLLSKSAEIDTKPQLEIHADDVTASHGATVGQLDENMIFYLRSRGIDYSSAHALLVYGFAHDFIEKITIEPLKNHLEDALVDCIPNVGQLSEFLRKHL